jgi:hypothetical protein
MQKEVQEVLQGFAKSCSPGNKAANVPEADLVLLYECVYGEGDCEIVVSGIIEGCGAHHIDKEAYTLVEYEPVSAHHEWKFPFEGAILSTKRLPFIQSLREQHGPFRQAGLGSLDLHTDEPFSARLSDKRRHHQM